MEDFQKILELFESSSLDFLSYDDHKLRVKMRRNSGTTSPHRQREEWKPREEGSHSSISEQKHSEEKQNVYSMVCPTVGIFYRRPSPQEENYIEVGDEVKKGDVLCTLEAMKVFSEVKSPVDGIIRFIALEDGEMAGQGDLLFEIELC